MRGIGAGVRVFEVLDRTPAIPYGVGEEVPKGHLGTIKFHRVHFEYPSRKGIQILKDFNLEIGVGESVAIVYVSPTVEYPPRLMTDSSWLVERVGVESLLSTLFSYDTTILSKERLHMTAKVSLGCIMGSWSLITTC